MSFVNALGLAPLRGKAVITTNATPTFGDCNTYSTTTSGSDLTITLPQVAIQTVGAQMLLEKDANDTTENAVTFNCYGTEQFTDTTTSLTLTVGGQSRIVQVVNMSGVLQWKIVGGLGAASELTPSPVTPDPDPDPGVTTGGSDYGGYGYGGYGDHGHSYAGDHAYGGYSS